MDEFDEFVRECAACGLPLENLSGVWGHIGDTYSQMVDRQYLQKHVAAPHDKYREETRDESSTLSPELLQQRQFAAQMLARADKNGNAPA